jgi:hypothetical protein
VRAIARAAGGLPDDEPPAGEVAPRTGESLAAYTYAPPDVGWTAASSADEVAFAVGDEPGDGEPDEQPGPCDARSGADCGEHTSADHRAEADHDRVADAEAAARRPGEAVPAPVTRS